MAKILQVIDVDSEGCKVRLDDGSVNFVPHGTGHPTIGQEVRQCGGEFRLFGADSCFLGRHVHLVETPTAEQFSPGDALAELGIGRAPTFEQLNSPAQVEAQKLSEAVKNAVDTAGQSETRQESEHAEEAPPVE